MDRSLRHAAIAVSASCVALSGWFVMVFLWIAVQRASYPYDLEWMEGAMVDHIDRLLSGKALYVAPTIDFVPFIYNPLYYLIAAVPTLVLGVSHLPLRLVSIAATLSCFALIFTLVFKETRQKFSALVATGLFAGTFSSSAGWFDLARVDSTFLALCLGTWCAARFQRGRRGAMVAALLLGGAFLIKQAAIFLFPALVASTALLHGFKRTLWFLPVLGALAVVMGALEMTSHGWYSFYAFRVPFGHPNDSGMIVDFWKRELLPEFPMACVLGLYFSLGAASRVEWTAALKVHLPFVVFMVVMAYAMRVHSGSWVNDKMPAHAALAVTAGLGLALLRQCRGRAEGDGFRIFGGALALIQLVMLAYSPDPFLPTDADVREGDAFVAAMKTFSGDVLLTHHGALPRRIGKASFAHAMAMLDVLRSSADFRQAQQDLRRSLGNAFASQRFAAVFTDDDMLLPDVRDRYYASAPFGYNPALFQTKVGNYRPRFLYTPRR